mmetsp:Transcript_15028/g.38272  ORF Transcript_15028/g.38272 Transcript_15028/m.38272 type:complete len:84 (+) Transcript_15028:754-1005(+)
MLLRDQQLRADASAERMMDEQIAAKLHADAMAGLNRDHQPVQGVLEGGGLGGVGIVSLDSHEREDDDVVIPPAGPEGKAPWEN